ncbi:MAG: hypothetical protein CFK49_09920 [Armatimonadetes bacterium JP3_11]|jgi:hypothetical protein|nr:MAG: hypothetical protein CFK48_02480 [Armatimonadetes bacterium CP1_7O]OYT74135.1 MAG: hypothetical protein CFK49_09920 [Armatimonadetes bacterium JP3_11]RMH06674.1 MAG: hypothetical protein D6697_10115 [Armatimonadota bacterium]
MSQVFFATGGTELTRFFDATTPTNWYVCTTPDTTRTFSEFQNGNWNAAFVYWGSPTGQTDTFNAQTFVNQIRSVSPNTPFFLIVPSQYASQATQWQRETGAAGYIVWNTTTPSEFITQIRTLLNQYNIEAA